jgi:hypothetical protein
VNEKTPELKRKIPKRVEGYPVMSEERRAIRALMF